MSDECDEFTGDSISVEFTSKGAGKHPLEIEGTMNGKPFYFRARLHNWGLWLSPIPDAPYLDENAPQRRLDDWATIAIGHEQDAFQMPIATAQDIILHAFLSNGTGKVDKPQ
jgi:hypothetical protein